jgi:hypothetical protein
MSKRTLAILALLIVTGLAVPAIVQHRTAARIIQQNHVLREQALAAARLSAENQHLTNLVAQFRVAQNLANDQFQELVRLRSEVTRLQQPPSNSIAEQTALLQAQELSLLREELTQLRQEYQELSSLREDLQQLRASPSSSTQELAGNQQDEGEDRGVSLRIIRTQGPTFADKLKRSVSAQDDESFQQVFGRFLQVNGVPTNTVAAAAYDDRTGRVIVRAPQETLDQIERLTSGLDRAP